MHCPYCGSKHTEVVETRDSEDLDCIRRRRSCFGCNKRFTTYERVEHFNLLVIKRDGKREQFNRVKLQTGVSKSCEKTTVPAEMIEKIVTEVIQELKCFDSVEVESKIIGDLVALKLKAVDQVAYIRFASVFKRFVDAEDFEKELEGLTTKPVIKN